MEETGNFSSGCPGLYTRIFRIWAGSWSGAYTVYSIFQGPGRLLVRSVYKKLEKPGPGRNLYTQIFRAQVRFRVWSVYKILEKPGPGQNLYTQKFRAWASSWLLAYTESSKIQGPGRICILKFSGPGQVPGCWRIQKVRRTWSRAEPVYSKIQGPGRLLIPSVYKILEKLGQGEICILKNSGPGQVPGR